jgi:hypothetical protein
MLTGGDGEAKKEEKKTAIVKVEKTKTLAVNTNTKSVN